MRQHERYKTGAGFRVQGLGFRHETTLEAHAGVCMSDSLCAFVRACACVPTYSAGVFAEGGQGGRQAREVRAVQGVVAFEPVLARELERSPTNPTAYDACADKGEYIVSALTPRLSSLLCNSLLLPQVSAPHMTCMYPPPHMTCMYPPPLLLCNSLLLPQVSALISLPCQEIKCW